MKVDAGGCKWAKGGDGHTRWFWIGTKLRCTPAAQSLLNYSYQFDQSTSSGVHISRIWSTGFLIAQKR